MRSVLLAALTLASLALSSVCQAQVKISEVYRYFTNSTYYNASYIEIYNASDTPVDMTGWTLQRSLGTNWSVVATFSGPIPGRGYMLAQLGSVQATGDPLPTPDFTSALTLPTVNAMVAISRGSTVLSSADPFAGGTIEDFVGSGSAAFSESSPCPNYNSFNPSLHRNYDGCLDSDDNSVDIIPAPPGPMSSISGPGGCTADQMAATVSSQSTAVAVCEGGTATLSVSAGGAYPFTYEWRRNGVPLTETAPYSGVETYQLTITGVDATLLDNYTCYITNVAGDDESDPIPVSLLTPTSVGTPPQGSTVSVGDTITLGVTAAGSGPFAYQWRRETTPLTNSARIIGSNTAALQILGATLADSGNYDCVITGACSPSVTSTSATTTVELVGTNYPPQDHAGADLVLAEGDVIWGLHTNVGNFRVPAGVTAKVRPYDGTQYGSLEVRAQQIDIAGTLTATGAGYTGGGGGGAGGNSLCVVPITQPGGAGGPGRYGTSFAGNTGGTGVGCGSPGGGGQGGAGDGSFAGVGGFGGSGTCVTPGFAGGDGGYAAAGTNGDTSNDDSLLMGSGGGGAGGESGNTYCSSTPYGSGGAAGGSGGGIIRLVASNSFLLQGTGEVLANGTLGGPGVSGGGPGAGGDASLKFASYRGGGAGAGGGVLIDVRGASSAIFENGCRVSTLGGRPNTTAKTNNYGQDNGGTIKVLETGNLTLGSGIVIRGGRSVGVGLSTSVTDWMVY